MDDRLIQIYIDRFVNNTNIWFKQWVSFDGARASYAHQAPDMDTKGGKYTFEPVTQALVSRHFKGKVTAAWTAIDENYRSKWLCFDSDTEDGGLDKLEHALKSWGLHVIREGRRIGRAGHLWVLFDQPIKAELLIILGDMMLRLVGAHLKSAEFPDGIERFPKYPTKLSQVRGPLGINLKPEANGARGWFDGIEHNIKQQLEWLAAQPLNKAAEVVREAERHRPAPKIRSELPANEKYWHGNNNRINILEYVTYRKVGKQLIAQCPICAREGHDRHRDNLQIKPDGSKFCCVFGGSGEVHKNSAIVKTLLGGKSV